MTVFEMLYAFAIKPLQLIFELIFAVSGKGIDNPGLSIIVLSLAMNFLVLPLYMRADAVQEEEKNIENKLRNGVAHIKKTFKGDEKMMMLQTYYRQNNYRPTDVFKGSVSLFLEIPFFIAAYQFLSHLAILEGVAFGPIRDLGAEDALINIGGFGINLLPIIMTAVNLISCVIYTKGYPLKTKIQLYGMAVFFFFFLYKSPSGLVFYWTLNNVFSLVKTICYKVKDIKKILSRVFAVIGVIGLACLPLARMKTGSKSFLLLWTAAFGACLVPMAYRLLKKKYDLSKLSVKAEGNSLLFFSGCVYMAVLTGVLIPSAVIKSSPKEFVDIYRFSDPIWFVVSAACISFGLFVLWFGVFYGLAGKDKRVYFDWIIWILCGIATINYMVFGKNAEILDSSLRYTKEFTIASKDKIINLVVCVAAAAVLALLYYFLKKKLTPILLAAAVAVLGMSIFNIVGIEKGIKDIRVASAQLSNEMPHFTFSKEGKNVVVLMLDRAIGEYIPYFVNEKPELKKMYSGFTYYPNTLSFGQKTNVGSPPLYGGYEYTPTEMNKRDDVLLAQKHDEAIKVMPVLFDENGYNVTICDPTYAGYSWIPDLSVYDEYPNIKTYITEGYFRDSYGEDITDRNFRNFFGYSIMKISPLCVQNMIYDSGRYNENLPENFLNTEVFENIGQTNSPDCLTAYGVNDAIYDMFSVLENMETMTVISDDDSDNFLMMSNDSTHDCSLFQEPEYVVTNTIDNTEYEATHQDRYEVNGIRIEVSTGFQFIHYQSNMAAILQLGHWFEYLKEQGVYDNTRIIIVSDHGSEVHHNEMYELDDGSDDLMDIELYNPLLLIKDFDAKEFTVDEQFMTNADVPTYAFDDLIDNPTNPFTGKEINNEEKYAHPQYVFSSPEWNVEVNNKETFDPHGIWFEVSKDMRDKNNWTIISDDR